MMASMPLIPDPDYLKTLFGVKMETLTKEDLETMGYCKIPS